LPAELFFVNQPTVAQMTIKEFEDLHEVFIMPKSSHWFHKVAGWFIPAWNVGIFSVLRFPGRSRPVIWVPDARLNQDGFVSKYSGTLKHELVHCHQQSSWWGVTMTSLLVTVLPLPVFYSGRWWVERYAFLKDIERDKASGKYGKYTPEIAAQILHESYGRPWPVKKMIKWFETEINKTKPF